MLHDVFTRDGDVYMHYAERRERERAREREGERERERQRPLQRGRNNTVAEEGSGVEVRSKQRLRSGGMARAERVIIIRIILIKKENNNNNNDNTNNKFSNINNNKKKTAMKKHGQLCGKASAGKATLGWHCLSQATCLIRPRLFCVFRRVKDHHNSLHYSPRLKKTCVRQVVLDKRLSLRHGGNNIA